MPKKAFQITRLRLVIWKTFSAYISSSQYSLNVPQYDNWVFVGLWVQYMLCTSNCFCFDIQNNLIYTTFKTCSTNNLLSFFGLIDARITKNRQEITCISAIANIKTCKLCNQGFLDDNSLANHVTDLHTVLNTCDECNNEFPTGKSFSETLIFCIN